MVGRKEGQDCADLSNESEFTEKRDSRCVVEGSVLSVLTQPNKLRLFLCDIIYVRDHSTNYYYFIDKFQLVRTIARIKPFSFSQHHTLHSITRAQLQPNHMPCLPQHNNIIISIIMYYMQILYCLGTNPRSYILGRKRSPFLSCYCLIGLL